MLHFLKRAVQMGKLQDEAGAEGGSPTGATAADSGTGGNVATTEATEGSPQNEQSTEQEAVQTGGEEGAIAEGESQQQQSPQQQVEASNDVLSTAENFLVDAGVDSQAFIDAYLTNGAFSDGDKAALSEKFGEAQAQMIMYNIESSVNSIMDAKKQEAAALHEMVGGEEQFSAIMEWAGHEDSGLDENTRTTLNDMFQRGGDYAEIATQYLYMGYNVSNGNDIIQQHANEVPHSGNVSGVKGIEPISYGEYSKLRDAARTDKEVEYLEKRARHTLNKGLAPQYNWPVNYS